MRLTVRVCEDGCLIVETHSVLSLSPVLSAAEGKDGAAVFRYRFGSQRRTRSG